MKLINKNGDPVPISETPITDRPQPIEGPVVRGGSGGIPSPDLGGGGGKDRSISELAESAKGFARGDVSRAELEKAKTQYQQETGNNPDVVGSGMDNSVPHIMSGDNGNVPGGVSPLLILGAVALVVMAFVGGD